MNRILTTYIEYEANTSYASQRFTKCSTIRSHTCLCNKIYECPLNVYQYILKYLALSASNVPRGLYCHVKLCKLRQCVINRKDSRYDPHFVCVLRVSSERIVDVLGNLLDRPPT